MEILNENTDELKRLISSLDEVSESLEKVFQKGKPKDRNERYLNNKEVCELLHVSERTLQDYRDKRLISYYKLEGKILYKLSDIEKLLEDNYLPAWE